MVDNRELDKWLAIHVMGWRFIRSFPDNEHVFQDEKTTMIKIPTEWNPPESISDAMQVVDKMMEKFPDWFCTIDVFGKNYQGDDRVVVTFQESAEGYVVHSCVGGKLTHKLLALQLRKRLRGEYEWLWIYR